MLKIGLNSLTSASRFSKHEMPRTFNVPKRCTTVPRSLPSNVANKPVAYWLLGMSGLVAGMVTVGGITRLTKSGLSMTDWTLQGSLPPLDAESWNKEFERYKLFPEWQQRKSMTVDEFKYIYFWEYGHRMMGRFLGIAFVVPLTYFGVRGMIQRALIPRLGLLFGLGGFQGLVGWWMVKSGLEMDPQQKKEIRVSPYRLATHLMLAFTTFTALLWTGLDLLNPAQRAKDVALTLSNDVLKHAKSMRRFAAHNAALVFLTVVTGAFVAGNDAGRAFNTWPDMNGEFIPSDYFELNPKWRNFFENTAAVQFDHRTLALSTLGAIGLMYGSARRAAGGAVWAALPSYSRLAYHGVAAMAITQVSLGIATLLLYVPVPLAALHQAGSLSLLTLTTCLAHSLRFSKFPTAQGHVAAANVIAAGTRKIVNSSTKQL